MSFLTFHLPAYSPLSLQALGAAAAGSVLGTGDAAGELRRLLCEEYDAPQAVLTGSGAQALQLAIRTAIDARPDRPPLVGLPAYTCFEVAAAAIGAGAKVALYDVDPATLSPDPAGLSRVLARGPAAVVVSPLFGVPVDWDAVADGVRASGAVLIEDAAQGSGGRWKGKPLGALGALSVLSFGRGKGWSGVRGGGMLARGEFATDDTHLPAPGLSADASVVLAGAAQWLLGRPSLYRLPRSIPWLGLGQTRYHDPAEPEAMPRLASALALRSRASAEAEAAIRRQNARQYLDELPEDELLKHVRPPTGGEAGYLRFPIRLRHGLASFRTPPTPLGIEAGYPSSLSELPQLALSLVNPNDRFPGAAELAERLVTLPTHSRLSAGERAKVVRSAVGCHSLAPIS